MSDYMKRKRQYPRQRPDPYKTMTTGAVRIVEIGAGAAVIGASLGFLGSIFRK